MEEDSKTTSEAAYPPILDACCGGRMMYFDKRDKRVLGQDIRVVPRCKIESNGSWFEVAPDVVGDFRKMEFPDDTFSLVVFDPPHLNCGKTSFMFYKYGTLDAKTWDSDLRSGFAECFRVLKPGGTLVFKWSDAFRSLKQVLELTPYKPVFSHTVKSMDKKNKTFFVVFFKESDTPRRNCDVGTAEEQAKRFHEFCRAYWTLGNHCSAKCPFLDAPDVNHCQAGWAQMPYEEGTANE